MQEQLKVQEIPVKVYRTPGRLMIAAPMPGIEPEDVLVQITDDGRLILQGELRGLLKDVKELLVDEWSAGGYYRELPLPNAVDGMHANVTYGNGVVVVVLPISSQTTPASLTLETVSPARGQQVGNVGHIQA